MSERRDGRRWEGDGKEDEDEAEEEWQAAEELVHQHRAAAGRYYLIVSQ